MANYYQDALNVLEENKRKQQEYIQNQYNNALSAYQAQQKANEDKLRAQINQSVTEREAGKGVAKQRFTDSGRSAYIQNQMAQKNLGQQLSAQGLNGGMSESSRVALDAQYGNAYNGYQRDYNNSIDQIDKDIAGIRSKGDLAIADNANNYANLIAQAKNQYNSQLAENEGNYNAKLAELALQEQQYQRQLEEARRQQQVARLQEQQNAYSNSQQEYEKMLAKYNEKYSGDYQGKWEDDLSGNGSKKLREIIRETVRHDSSSAIGYRSDQNFMNSIQNNLQQAYNNGQIDFNDLYILSKKYGLSISQEV